MIEANIRLRLGEFQLNASLSGEGVICLAGRNGSGKTTLMRAIAGFLPLNEGFVRVRGVDVASVPVERRRVVLVTPSSCFTHMRVDSHIVWGAKLKGVHILDDRVLKVKSELGIDFDGKVRKLSRGMRQRVALGTVLLSSPEVILVDEAFLGLNDRETFISTYGTLAKQAGIDIIFSSQDEADGRLADYLYVLNNGVATPKHPGASS